jgi:hypothetical protein
LTTNPIDTWLWRRQAGGYHERFWRNLELTRARSHVFPTVPTANPYTATQFLYATNGGNTLGGSGFPLGWGPISARMGIVRMLQ